MYRVLKLFWPFEGNCKADVAPGENEFYTPVLSPPYTHCSLFKAHSSRVWEVVLFSLKVISAEVFHYYKILIHDRKSSN